MARVPLEDREGIRDRASKRKNNARSMKGPGVVLCSV